MIFDVDELIASGTPVRELRLFASAVLDLSRLPSRFPYLLVTPQYQTERVLEERARRVGADVQYGTEVTALTQRPDGVEMKARQDGHPDRVIRTGYVVGTDGMRGTVRQAGGACMRRSAGAGSCSPRAPAPSRPTRPAAMATVWKPPPSPAPPARWRSFVPTPTSPGQPQATR